MCPNYANVPPIYVPKKKTLIKTQSAPSITTKKEFEIKPCFKISAAIVASQKDYTLAILKIETQSDSMMVELTSIKIHVGIMKIESEFQVSLS